MINYTVNNMQFKKDLIAMEPKKKYYISLFESTNPKENFLYTSCAHLSLEDLELADPSDREGFVKIVEIEV